MTPHLVFIAAVGLAIVVLALVLILKADRRRRSHQARLRRLRPQIEAQITPATRKRSTKQNQQGFFAPIERQLAQTSLRVTVVELTVQISLAVLGLYALLVLLAGVSPFTAVPVAIAVPLAAATVFVRMAKARYRFQFTEALPEALDVFARGMRAGRPVSDSLSIVVKTAKGAIQREFGICHNEICMGTTLPDSLSRLEQRLPTPEVSFFSVATSLQAETGGNLIETMEGLAHQLRERRKLRKKARALSSEARASAMILAALPFAVATAIAFLNGSYLAPLYADPRGQVMSLVAITSIGLGVFVMARMGKLDV